MENKKNPIPMKLTRAEQDKNKLERCLGISSIRAMEGEGNERKFEISFSSEEPYERWFGMEILCHDEGCVDLTRLNEIGVLLFNHDRDKVIGKINRAWIEENRGKAEIEFDKDEESEHYFQKVKSGTLKGVSVGYMVNEWQDVQDKHKSADGRFEGPCSIAMKWTPFEVSIVSVPADATVGVGRSAEEHTDSHKAQEQTETKGVSSFYYNEKQLQINQNLK